MRLVPVVAVVPEDALSAFAPAVEATEKFLRANPEFGEQAARNGWTAEALAYGQLLSGSEWEEQ